MADRMENSGYFLTGRLFWWYWFPLFIYCVIIFVQSAYPSPDSLPSFPYSDKVMHFLGYGIMGGLFSRAFLKTCPKWGVFRIIFFSVLLTTLCGVGDEFHQSFVASRMSEGMDVIADMAGGTVGAIGFFLALLFLGRMNTRLSE